MVSKGVGPVSVVETEFLSLVCVALRPDAVSRTDSSTAPSFNWRNEKSKPESGAHDPSTGTRYGDELTAAPVAFEHVTPLSAAPA